MHALDLHTSAKRDLLTTFEEVLSDRTTWCCGRGMLAGIDFGLGNTNTAKEFHRLALRDGVIVERCGPDGEVTKLMQPVNTEPERLESGLDRPHKAVQSMPS